MPTILTVDDENDLRELIVSKLKQEGFETLDAADGLTAEKLAFKHAPDLIVLDLMLPGKDGIAVCKSLRKDVRTRSIPILMLTARGGIDEKISGLQTGADDYMTKPFSVKELVLRIRNILRRTMAVKSGAAVEIGNFLLDRSNLKFHLAGEEIDLTSTEFKLLLALVEIPGSILERSELLEKVWGYSELVQTRTLDTHIKRLRTKLGSYCDCIETVRAVGYRFDCAKSSNSPEA